MEWKPAHIADRKLSSTITSAPTCGKPSPAYTFGAKSAGEKAADVDRQNCMWWQPSAKPTTNQSRNADVETFWLKAQQDPKEVLNNNQRQVAIQTKVEGRGSNLRLGEPNVGFAQTSLYLDSFCGQQRGSKQLTMDIMPPAAAPKQYYEARAAAKANKSLTVGSKMDLSHGF